MATVFDVESNPWKNLRGALENFLVELGELSMFASRVFAWIFRRTSPGTLLPVCYSIGILSIPVVAITGMFIGKRYPY